jgi:CO/xanthine dehydrogenase Mo-binding subunit
MKRRAFLGTGGALVVSFSLHGALAQGQAAAPAKPAAPKLPGSLDKLQMIDGWIRIDANGNVTVFTGKGELGQGIKTALIQVAAEELVVPIERVTLVTADTERTANEGYTSGSNSMKDSGTAIRHAAAQARVILMGIAASKLGMPVEQLSVENGMVQAGTQKLPYGQLVAGDVLHVTAQPQSTFRDPKLHNVMGKPVQRVDIPAKVSGGAAYVQDLRLDGMVHARIVRPPSPGATLTTLDASVVQKMPGVLKVVNDGNFIAVIAQGEYQAVTAMRALAEAAKWNRPATLPDQSKLYESVLASPAENYTILDRGALSDNGAKTVSATYMRPYQEHASIGPSCAVAQLVDDKYTVWTHSQGVFPLRKALAEMLATPEAKVHCIHVEGSGCYGHNGADDVAADASLLARALPGKPVRVQWMREDEHAWEPFGPPMVASAKATVDSAGNITSWLYEVWSNTHSTRAGGAGDLLPAMHLAKPFVPTPPKPLPLPEGGGDRNAIPYYTLPNAKVVHHFLPQMPLRVSALRGLGAYHNVYSIESFMEELALAAKVDSVDFRMRHMADSRARDVMRLAADRFGWTNFRAQKGRGRGFAFARYKNLAAYAAIACEVEVWPKSNNVRILRVVAAVDSGEVVNPDGIRNQMEGGIVQSASWTTLEGVSFDTTRVTSLDWGGYPILRFPNVPEHVDVHVIDRPGQPFLGTGEAAQGPTAAAIANAVANALGVRELPLMPRVQTAVKV